MFIPSMSRWLPAVLISCAPALFAGDVTGDWSGQLTAEGDSRPIAFELHQTGNHVEGMVSFRAGLLIEGTLEGSTLRLDGKAYSRTFHFELALNGNRLEGSALMTMDGEKGKETSLGVSKLNSPASQNGLSGTWLATIESAFNGETVRPVFTMRLDQQGSVIKGDMTDSDSHKIYPLSSVSMDGNSLVMTLVDKGDTGRFELVREGDKLTGKLIVTEESKTTSGRVTAVRQI